MSIEPLPPSGAWSLLIAKINEIIDLLNELDKKVKAREQ